MSTVNLNIYTSAWSTVTNNIVCNVYAQSDPLAIVATITDSITGHPARTWSFPGLVRANYRFEFLEVTSGGTTVQSLGSMDVVPSSDYSNTFRTPIAFQCGVSAGVGSGTNTITLDGTSGSPDIRGWEIAIERISVGTMKPGIDYSYNQNTGLITLLTAGDVFQLNEWYNITFQPQSNVISDPVPSLNVFNSAQLINSNYTILTSDFGTKIIIKPTTSNGYLELQLPDITTVVANRVLFLEMDGGNCAKFITHTGDSINWLQDGRSSLFICPNEKISIYKFIDTSTGSPVNSWRIHDAFGNFMNVGQLTTEDQIQANVLNKIALTGTQCDVFKQARLYNDFVLQLPSGQVCNYDDWNTGNNKYKYSLANSSNSANANKFMIPDRRNLFERITDGTRKAGDYQADQMIQHQHEGTIGNVSPTLFGRGLINRLLGIYGGGGNYKTDLTGPMVNSTGSSIAGGTEVTVKNYAVYKFVLI